MESYVFLIDEQEQECRQPRAYAHQRSAAGIA